MIKLKGVTLAAILLSASSIAIANNGNGNNDDEYPGASCSVGNASFCEGPVGPQGPQGEQGPKGDKGNAGSDGEDGVNGKDGADGERGPRGYDGIDGKNGSDGKQGPKGEKGSKGDTGPKGESYDPAFIEELNKQIYANEKRINAAAASAFAAASHQFDVYGDTQFSVAGGYYESESAVSIAIGSALNERTFINGNLTQDSRGNTGAGVGITFQLN